MLTPQAVRAHGDGFEVFGIAAGTIAAQMVDHSILWYRADPQVIDNAMHPDNSRALSDDAIASSIQRSSPEPASVVLLNYSRPQPFL